MTATTLLQRRSDLRVRLPLQRRAGRRAVCRTASLPFDLLCAQGQFRLPQAAAARSNWWPDRSWSAIPATNMSAPTIIVCGDECLSFFLEPGTGGGDRRPRRDLADRLRAAAARIDGARRTGAGRGRRPQRYRPRRDRPCCSPAALSRWCRGGAQKPVPATARDRRRAVETALWIDAHSHRPIDLEARRRRRPASARSISCGCFPACSASPRTSIWCARGCAMPRGCWPTTTARSPTSPTMSASATSPISCAPSTAPPASRRAGSAQASRGDRKIFQERLALH